MRWHLLDASHGIVRTATAGSLAEARFRLAPIPANHAVVSDAAYQTLGTTRTMSPMRTRLAKTSRAAIARRQKAKRQAKWRAYRSRKLADDPQFDHKRRHAHRLATSAKLAQCAGTIVGLMVEQVDERTIAARFGVAQQSVSNLRQLYRVPTARTIRRKQVECLARYYAAQGLPLYEVAARARASVKMVRSILSEVTHGV